MRVSTEGSFEAISTFATVPVLRVQRERDRVRVDAELMLSMRGVSFDTVVPVLEASFSPREAGVRTDLELCYPAAGESLWEISRRYAVPPSEIAVANGIGTEDMATGESLASVRYLMIPKS